jgi:glycosyltransferase involved in cell wall biosynthesis
MTHTGSSNQKLRVAIDCRINDFRQGIGTAVQALAKVLSDSNIREQEYSFIIRESMRDRLEPYVYGPCSLEIIPESKLQGVKASLRWIAPLRFVWKKIRGTTVRIPISDGYVESRRFDVIHFPTQVAYETDLPTIYQPHDLQHVHYPEYFSEDEFARREREYRAFCDQASFVCVHADWTKKDIIEHYNLAVSKVAVIKWGLVFDAYGTPTSSIRESTIRKYGLPSQFFFYPAVTWPHKNHECIIRALHILKEEYDITPDIFFSGALTPFRRNLDRIAKHLGVSRQLHYLGFIPSDELQAIYGVASAMIYSSKFEGFGLPILEAFHSNLPVLCSNATVLPEIAQGGALYFDPDSPKELCVLMQTILDDEPERRRLINEGKRVLSKYSFQNTATQFQELYRRAANI